MSGAVTAGSLSLPALPLAKQGKRALGLLALLVVAASFVAVGVGAVGIAPAQTLAILAESLGVGGISEFAANQQSVLLSIRLPRVLLSIAVGAALAISGAAMQGLFRNPLADPGLVGISSGAALAATATIVLGEALAPELPETARTLLLPVAAFLGSLATTFLVWRVATRSGHTAVATMLLAGIALNALTGAGTGVLTLLATDPQLRTLTFWTLGSLNGATWPALWIVLTMSAPALILIPRLSRALNALLLGEAEARHLGIEVERVKAAIVLLTALAVGATVAACGMIGFVGLAAPHLIRLLLGADHRVLLPGAALLGAALLVLADLAARTVVAPAEVPIGIVTTLLGAPFFLWLMVREAEHGGLFR